MEDQRFDPERFIQAHNRNYAAALSEIRAGKKCSHWMWYIFPQLTELGRSEYARRYGIPDVEAAKEFLAHPVLGEHLLTITRALLQLQETDLYQVMGSPDYLKLCSCMTLFEAAAPEHPEFAAVLEKFYSGQRDRLTLDLLKGEKQVW